MKAETAYLHVVSVSPRKNYVVYNDHHYLGDIMKKYLPWIAAVIIGFFLLGPIGSVLGVAIYAGVQHFAK